ncbi:hypothetical protein J6590_063299 [Homalodisca vitripennis]|nr:hypothetical protein J6590_063299 [Homalodisca vitripennis]
MNDKGWTVQKRLLSARCASQMAVFDNEIESKPASQTRFDSYKKGGLSSSRNEARVARIKRKLGLVEEEENADGPEYGSGMF